MLRYSFIGIIVDILVMHETLNLNRTPQIELIAIIPVDCLGYSFHVNFLSLKKLLNSMIMYFYVF